MSIAPYVVCAIISYNIYHTCLICRMCNYISYVVCRSASPLAAEANAGRAIPRRQDCQSATVAGKRVHAL